MDMTKVPTTTPTNYMYRENRQTINWFVGCNHRCVYCQPSFQAQMKRQLHNCLKCYNYEPHAHLERLSKPPPKTEGNEFIFFPSSGDPAFATHTQFQTAIDYAEKYQDRLFLIQSKQPQCFLRFDFPQNVMLATTIETDKIIWRDTPSQYTRYLQISKAPYPFQRARTMRQIRKQFPKNQIILTAEPILDFHHYGFLDELTSILPDIVYVGYDNHNCKLPEPPLEKTEQFIEKLEQFTEVRVKTLRKAWYEQ
jgi:hypothetical protein